MAPFYIFANLFYIWLSRRQLDSLLCFFIQHIALVEGKKEKLALYRHAAGKGTLWTSSKCFHYSRKSSAHTFENHCSKLTRLSVKDYLRDWSSVRTGSSVHGRGILNKLQRVAVGKGNLDSPVSSKRRWFLIWVHRLLHCQPRRHIKFFSSSLF